jgi:D-alanine--poly(phosphoribitol) ligase subunit 1
MLERLHNSLVSNLQEPAFFIRGNEYAYQVLNRLVASFQHTLFPKLGPVDKIGIIANDDLETYAGIIACLLSGIAFVPIEPSHPGERNNSIIKQSKLDYILCSSGEQLSSAFLAQCKAEIIAINKLDEAVHGPVFNSIDENALAYILFTSGTTGIPKGVPISRRSLQRFLASVFEEDKAISKQDRFLQLFDLTFDLSIYSYLVPLIAGACVYTIPKNEIKYSYAINLMQEYEITCVLSVPSFVGFLRPYFKEINLPSMRRWLFCGEALQAELVMEWQGCLPGASILNVYGPTEATIFCTSYPCNVSGYLKTHNGKVCIGKPYREVGLRIIDDNFTEVLPGDIGEICISGSQLTQGYIQNVEKNREAFIRLDPDEDSTAWYRTGDLGFKDEEGDFYFAGRTDSQVKIQGYRVELGEIESQALAFDPVKEAVAVHLEKKQGMINLYLFVKPRLTEEKDLLEFLRTRIPEYMLPKQIFSLDDFPLNVNGKTDRNALKGMIG